jgi:small-conductance mechanosensitive channel
VQIGEHLGDVIDLDAFHVTLMEAGRWADGEQSTGRLLKLPNRLVAGAVVANYTSGLEIIWDEFTVTLTLESNWHKGRDLLQEIGDRLVSPPTGELMERYRHLTSQYLLEQGPLTPAVYVKLSERGVGLSLRYLCLPRQRRDVQRALSEEVLNIFAGHDDLRMMRVPQG